MTESEFKAQLLAKMRAALADPEETQSRFMGRLLGYVGMPPEEAAAAFSRFQKQEEKELTRVMLEEIAKAASELLAKGKP